MSGQRFKTNGGNCKSRNVVYAALYTDCLLQYVGQTTQTLRDRINGHRASCSGSSRIGKKRGSAWEPQDLENDYKALLNHMLSIHGKHDFNSMYIFTVCERNVSPRSLDFTEQAWVAKLQTVRPKGINIANPCGVHQDLVTRVLHDL